MIIEILRYVIALQAAWVLGVALAVLPAYIKDRYFAHIGLMTVSYSGLVLLATFRSWYGVFIPEVVYIPVVSALILLGDISLLMLLRRNKTRRLIRLRETGIISRGKPVAVEFIAEFRHGALKHSSPSLNVLAGISEVAEILPDGKYKWLITLDVDQARLIESED